MSIKCSDYASMLHPQNSVPTNKSTLTVTTFYITSCCRLLISEKKGIGVNLDSRRISDSNKS